jgi:hypothetical protein
VILSEDLYVQYGAYSPGGTFCGAPEEAAEIYLGEHQLQEKEQRQREVPAQTEALLMKVSLLLIFS